LWRMVGRKICKDLGCLSDLPWGVNELYECKSSKRYMGKYGKLELKCSPKKHLALGLWRIYDFLITD